MSCELSETALSRPSIMSYELSESAPSSPSIVTCELSETALSRHENHVTLLRLDGAL